MKNFYAVIMAGGVGSRFWPASKTTRPKQFLNILGTEKTLIQATYERFSKIVPSENIFVVTNEIYKSFIQKQLPQLSSKQVLYEPIMRNTAPCIAYASYKIHALNPHASIVVTPSDHLILDTHTFVNDLTKALETASKHHCLITLGMKPSRPDTGYGYIQYNNEKLDHHYCKIKTFTEKPNAELAKTFIQSGDFLWNSGIFVWSTTSILQAFEQHLPEMNDIFKEGINVYNTPYEEAFIQTAYCQCTNISIDYGILEKANNVYVLPTDFGWSDLGTWASIYALSEKDPMGNVTIPAGKTIIYDSSNCMVNSDGQKLVILKGLHDYIVIESDTALLIFPKNQEQAVKQIVADVKSRFGTEYV